jgi:purine-binding chemotaxis protein CheW
MKLQENETIDHNLTEIEDTLKDRYLSLRIGDENYAFEIQYVTEIIGIQKITKVPNIKEYIKGIINLRGIIIPVVNIRTRFGMEEIDYNDRTCIVVIRIHERTIGLIVDEVYEVYSIASNDIDPRPPINKSKNSNFIKGIGKLADNVSLILDLTKLLFDEDYMLNKENNE